MVPALLKLKLYMKAVFNTNFHLNLGVRNRFLSLIENNELFLLGDFVMWPVDHHVDVVANAHHYTIVGLKLLLAGVECEIIGRIFC